MEEATLNIVGQYGALGLFAIIAVYMIKNMIKESALRDREHMEERQSFREMMDTQHKETLEVAKNANANQIQLIALNREIKTLLKNGYGKKN